MPKIIEWVACYYAGRSGRGNPCASVTIETAREMVEVGQANWSKGMKYLKLTKIEASLSIASRSIQMGPSVIEGCAMGDVNDIALRDAWEVRRAA